jgi:hypothetical protein
VVVLLVVAFALCLVSLPGDYLVAFLLYVVVAPTSCLFVAASWLDKNRSALRRTRAGWLGMAALGFSLLALIVLDVPTAARFDLSRPALDQAAARAEAGDRVDPGWIGLMPVESIRRQTDGTIVFVVTQFRLGGGSCGLAHNGQREPSAADRGRRMADGWWIWCDEASD